MNTLLVDGSTSNTLKKSAGYALSRCGTTYKYRVFFQMASLGKECISAQFLRLMLLRTFVNRVLCQVSQGTGILIQSIEGMRHKYSAGNGHAAQWIEGGVIWMSSEA